MEVVQAGVEYHFGVTPHLKPAFAHVHRRRVGAGFAHKMAVAAEAMRTQNLHHVVAVGGAHLQHHPQLFAEQGLERQFFAPGTDLSGPVFGVAVLGTAVANAVALGD